MEVFLSFPSNDLSFYREIYRIERKYFTRAERRTRRRSRETKREKNVEIESNKFRKSPAANCGARYREWTSRRARISFHYARFHFISGPQSVPFPSSNISSPANLHRDGKHGPLKRTMSRYHATSVTLVPPMIRCNFSMTPLRISIQCRSIPDNRRGSLQSLATRSNLSISWSRAISSSRILTRFCRLFLPRIGRHFYRDFKAK